MVEIDFTEAEWIVVIALYLFLPLTALTYLLFRRGRRKAEIDRIFDVLEIDQHYKKTLPLYCLKYPALDFFFHFAYFVLVVTYSSVIALLGLLVLLHPASLEILDQSSLEFPSMLIGNVEFPQPGSRLVFGMAFLGAYLWGLQHLFRRYSLDDLTPRVYYTFSIRMIFAAVIALMIYNAYTALAGGAPDAVAGDNGRGITSAIWPALAFLIGMFPQRGLRWLTDRMPIFSSGTDPCARELPIEMIEGITIHDRLRFEELGIDNCQDLATADFVPLILKTPYSARELVDWILQAKLCVYFGVVVQDLRRHGIRTILDLEGLDDTRISDLAEQSAVTKSALKGTRKSLENEMEELKRLHDAKIKLGKFTGIKEEDESTPPPTKKK